MSQPTPEEQIAVLEKQNVEFNNIVRDLDRMARKNLWWFFFIPLFGMILYSLKLQKRKSAPEYSANALKVKTEIAKNEFTILKLKKTINHVI